MANLTRYFSTEEELFIKSQPEAYLRGLVRAAMGVSFEGGGVSKIQKDPIEKLLKLSPDIKLASNIERKPLWKEKTKKKR